MASSFLLPILAVFLRTTFVDVTYPDFALHAVPMALVLTILVVRLRKGGLLRPVHARLFSWELPVFLFAKWPWVLFGTIAAVRDWLTGSFVDFKVTPKGTSTSDRLPFHVLVPYAFLSVASALPVILVENAQFASGFYIFALMNALIYGAIYLLALIKHGFEKHVRDYSPSYRFGTAVVSLGICVTIAVGLELRGLRGVDAVTYGTPYFELMDRTFPVSGAGQGGSGVWTVKFNPHWLDQTEMTLPNYDYSRRMKTRN